MRSATVGIIFDSLRHDFITPEFTPVLYAMRERGISGTIQELLGFMMSPGWFAGIYPQTSGLSQAFKYSPGTSPYRLAKWFPHFFERQFLLNKAARRILRKWIEWRASHPVMKSYSYTYRIPFRLLPFFDAAEKRYPWETGYVPVTTLFDLLREKNLEWIFIGNPGSNLRTRAVLDKLEASLEKDAAFIWLHFAELDWTEHEYGPDSGEVREKLREIDSAIGEAASILERRYDQVSWLILGDHGTVEVTGTLDMEAELDRLDLRRRKDYVYFLDSTLARFWFNHASAGEKITGLLRTLPQGKILGKEELKKYRSVQQDRSNWDLIFVVNEGTVISPNFFQGKERVMGMHGYLPDVRDNMASFVLCNGSLSGGIRLEEIRDMTDVFPTLCDLLGLPVPSSCEGRSLLARRAKRMRVKETEG